MAGLSLQSGSSSARLCRHLRLRHRLAPLSPTLRQLRHSASVRSDSSDRGPDPSRFGDFIPVLSENPHAVGVDHIPRVLSVPSHIMRPPYAQSENLTGIPEEPNGENIVKLGTSDETSMRKASRLANRMLMYGRSLVRVSGCCSSVRRATDIHVHC